MRAVRASRGREPGGPRGRERRLGTGVGDGVGYRGAGRRHRAGSMVRTTGRPGYELIGPEDGPGRATVPVLVDIENRGGRSTFTDAQPRDRAGTGGLRARAVADRRSRPGCPSTRRGSGWRSCRDFGRRMRERFAVLVMAGASQSAWFVNTFVAEGFNVASRSGSGVYAGAFAYLSGGNWLAINRLGDDGDAAGALRPSRRRAPPAVAHPHPPRERPVRSSRSPSYTDYYRLRASVAAAAARCRRAPVTTTSRARTCRAASRGPISCSAVSAATAGTRFR